MSLEIGMMSPSLSGTGSISTEDINNYSEYEANTKGSSGEFTYTKNPADGEKGANTASISPSLPMEDKGDDSSTTKSAIEDGSVIITDETAQLAETGQNAEEAVESLNRDTENAHKGALDKNPDLQELFDKQAELVDAASQAGRAVAETIGDISLGMYAKTGDSKWDEGGAYKIALQGAGSALVAQLGNGQGLNAALGAMASQLASGKVEEFCKELAGKFTDDPDAGGLLANLIQNAISNGIGFTIGGATGANSAATMDRWNRAMHDDQAARLRSFYEKYKDDPEMIARLMAAAAYLTNAGSDLPLTDLFRDDLMALELEGQRYLDEINMLNHDGLFNKRPMFESQDNFPYFFMQRPDWAEEYASQYNKEITQATGVVQVGLGALATGTGTTMVVGGTLATATGGGIIAGPGAATAGAGLINVGLEQSQQGYDNIFNYESSVGSGIWYGLLGGVAVDSESMKLATSAAEQALMAGAAKIASQALPAAFDSINKLLNKGKVTALPPLKAPLGSSGSLGNSAAKPNAPSGAKPINSNLDKGNPLFNLERTGSALKQDQYHAFPDIVDNYAKDAKKFTISSDRSGVADLLQIEGSYQGKRGVFEWIVDSNEVTHRRFIPGGSVTGTPNQISE